MEKNYNLNGNGVNLNSTVRNIVTMVAGSEIAARAIPSVICRAPILPMPALVASASVAIVLGVLKRSKRKRERK